MPQSYQAPISKAAQAVGIDPKFIAAMMKQESSYNVNAKSHAGASGLMQLMPATAKSLGVTDIYDPEQNIMGGAKYIKQQLDRFGSRELALAAYNAGPGRVQKAIQQAGTNDWNVVKRYLPAETQNYVPKVLGNYAT
ncbi:lytic transglycosylase domain-containing protein [Brevibacillus migulae]|uniref:lytic transglycosylase domain-containing protein n=1 Tax=Brevibacillus migulae TaxID=1644114 RepID=UPI002E256D76